ncbi:hypothetical protein VNO80_04266 [Phaseolus coccineus]|uniref:Uncharacterized protein n=1 Tax=Phaseolus coccineus TaxID=3886 RepID=A0AAN9P0G5_PHACN
MFFGSRCLLDIPPLILIDIAWQFVLSAFENAIFLEGEDCAAELGGVQRSSKRFYWECEEVAGAYLILNFLFGESAKTLNPKKARIIGGVRRSSKRFP